MGEDNLYIDKNYNNNLIFPSISNKLIKALNTAYPNKLPKSYISEFELGRLVGQREVIDRLVYEKEYQENKLSIE